MLVKSLSVRDTVIGSRPGAFWFLPELPNPRAPGRLPTEALDPNKERIVLSLPALASPKWAENAENSAIFAGLRRESL